jgi:non-heme chloroperoxidase
MNRYLLSVVSVLLAAAASASPQQAEWKDPSPHAVKSVAVDDGVLLEVLDWGGSGPPLLLLAGLGDAAHVFDDMAPTLARRHRVIGVTRRGHPNSSSPATGYGTARLAEDIVRVIDAAGLEKPVVVGHSVAGEEMHVLGARHADRIGGLIYVDAAFDRDDKFAEHEAAARALPGSPAPKPADLASFTALRAFMSKVGATWPEGRVRSRFIANADGSLRRWAPQPHVMQAFNSEMQALSTAYNPERIRVPALAIYAVPKSVDELLRLPWYDAKDPAVRARIETLYPLERENVARHARWFTAFAELGRVAELSGGHDLVVSNPGGVVQEIEKFMSLLYPRP